MIHTIQLDRILQGAVDTPYRDLVTRPTGAAVRSRVEVSISEAHCVTALLDFSSVGLLDFSCADEVVAQLLLRARSGEGHVLLMGLSEDQSEAIDHVLRNRHLVVAVLPHPGETPFLLGATSPEARSAFRFVHEMGPCNVADLALEMNWDHFFALAALQELAGHRLVGVDRDTYRPIPLQ